MQLPNIFFNGDAGILFQDLLKMQSRSPERHHPQKKLAEQLTLLVHGSAGLTSALTTTKILYDKDISALAEIPPHEVSKVFSQVRYYIFCWFRRLFYDIH